VTGLTGFADTPPSSQQAASRSGDKRLSFTTPDSLPHSSSKPSKPASKDKFAAYTTPRNDETPSHRNSAGHSGEKGKFQFASKPASKEKFAAYTTPRNDETPSHRNSAGPSGEKGKFQSAASDQGASGSGDKRLRKIPTVQSFSSMLGSQKGGDNCTSPSFAEDMESLQE
jgi:hypothetical protein